MQTLQTVDQLESALGRERLILFKHSTRCGLSSRAKRQIQAFMEIFPAAPVFMVDVISDRSVSDAIEARFRIRHESPQAILVEAGDPLQSAAHRRVQAQLLASWWEDDSPSS